MNKGRNKFYAWVRRWLIPIVMLFYPVDVHGRENIADEPVILCANHSSALDPILMIGALDRQYDLRIMAKQQLMTVPVVGWFIRKMGGFGVDRGNSDINSVKAAIRSLRDGWSLLVFPEGTRVKDMSRAEVKGGVAMMAIRGEVKLQPVFIQRNKKLFRKTRIIFGKAFAPVYTGRKGTAEEYQSNAEEVMRQAYELGEAK